MSSFAADDFTDLAAPRKASFPVWLGAALVAFGLHALCIVFLVTHLEAADPDDELGAQAGEIGLELMAPHLEPTDLPPGPEAEAAAAAPAVVEQKAKTEESELPKAQPTETDDPDRVVSPDAAKKPTPDDPKLAATDASPSSESVASEAAAPPTMETVHEAPRAVAPAIGSGESANRIRTTWQKELVAHLDRHKRYPEGTARRSIDMLVNFTLDRTGHVLEASIARGSGDAAYDAAALAMVRRSDPVPQPPPLVADEGLTFTLPVIFRAKGRS